MVGRRYVRNRWRYVSWCGDIAERTWSDPIDGAFQPLDGIGSLVEIRDRCDRSGSLGPTEVEWIESGRRKTVDIGFAGSVWPVFGTRYLLWWDARSEEVVLRSLVGDSEIRWSR